MYPYTKHIGILILIFIINLAFAQTPPPPNTHGTDPACRKTLAGGQAIAGNEIIIQTATALAYGKLKLSYKY